MRFLVRLYPAYWRRRYADEFEALLEELPRGRSAAVAADSVRHALAAHLRTRETAQLAVGLVLAVPLVLALGYVNLHNDEVQAPAAMIVLGAAAYSWWRPRLFWLWAPIFALTIPGSYLVARQLGLAPAAPPGDLWQTSIAFVPALIGAGIGAGCRLSSRLARSL